MTIRVFSFAGCPHAGTTEERVRKVAAQCDVEHRIEVVILGSDEDAIRHRVPGSPSVQIDGVDIEPSARNRSSFGLGCRLYGSSGVPPAAMIADAIRDAAR